MEQAALFEGEAEVVDGERARLAADAKGSARLVTADRNQLELRPFDLDRLIPSGHRARLIWQAIEKVDLSAFYEWIKAREHEPGRPPTDPKVLVALWLYATADGVGSAREVDRLCREHRAYEWIRGGVPLNYHTLADFRTAHEKALDGLFTQILAILMQADLISLKRVSQDGLRVRGSAGAGSFRRRKKLQHYLRVARRQVEAVKKLAEDGTLSARQQAARERAAREREERVRQALDELSKLERQRQAQSGGRKARSDPRSSMTDPEARRMRMGDGGFRPAYNIQFATDTRGQVIVGVSVSNNGSDRGQAPPMLKEVEQRTGVRPEQYLVDGGFTDKKTVDYCEHEGVTLFGPVPGRWGQDPVKPQPTDSAAVRRWRKRMATQEAKDIYKQRASTSERVNADVRTRRTLDRLLVRGTEKVLCVALWNALAYNILRWLSLAGHA
jgi:transposase